MQVKDRLTIRIEKIAFGGEGVGRIDNFVVFVPFAAPEEELEIEISKRKKKYARGKILKIVKASPWRVPPVCGYYKKCGGCCYQHISYEKQLAIKKQQIVESFMKIGRIAEPPVLEIVPSPASYSYRGKAQFHLIKSTRGPELGFLDISGRQLVNVRRCEIMAEAINAQIRRFPLAAVMAGKKDSRLTVWSDAQTGGAGEEGQIKRLVKGIEFRVPPEGFFQNNLFLTETLADEVCRLALADRLETLIDAYCGCGLFSILLAPSAKKVIGIELDEMAIKYAMLNAGTAHRTNIEFICSDVGEELLNKKNMLPPRGTIDLFILDPPRAGCQTSVLQALALLQPQRIIYVSCNPATQARDCRNLMKFGYNLVSLLPLDMFPQTQHMEVIGLLVRR